MIFFIDNVDTMKHHESTEVDRRTLSIMTSGASHHRIRWVHAGYYRESGHAFMIKGVALSLYKKKHG